MRPNPESEQDASLRQVLRQWTVDAPLPPRFEEQVWHRIALVEAGRKPSLWGALTRLLEAALPRPKIALSYVTALLVLGVAAGALTAQIKTSRLDAALSARYVHSVNPFPAGPSQP